MTKIIAVSILALSFATAAAAQGPQEPEKKGPHAESSITLAVAGLHCSTNEGSDTFNVTAYSFGAENNASTGTGGGAGKATVLPLSAMKKFDECSPSLFGGVVSGEHFQTVDLVQLDEKQHKILIITLTDALITSYKIGGSQASDTPVETIQIDFRKICISDPGGSNKFCFDRGGNTAS